MKPYPLFRRLTSFGFSIAIILGIVSIAFLVMSPTALAERDIGEQIEERCDQLNEDFNKKEKTCIEECNLNQKHNYLNTLTGLQNKMDDLGCEDVATIDSLCGGIRDIGTAYLGVTPTSSDISVGGIVKLSTTFFGPTCKTVSKGEKVEGEVSGSQSWWSDDRSIANVDQGGLVFGINPGITMIHVKSDDIPELRGDAQVRVDCDLKDAYIDVSTTDLKIDEDQVEQIEATPVGPDCLTDDFIWESRDESVATVDQNGNVTGVDQGITQIIVRHKTLVNVKSIVNVTVGSGNPIFRLTWNHKQINDYINGSKEWHYSGDVYVEMTHIMPQDAYIFTNSNIFDIIDLNLKNVYYFDYVPCSPDICTIGFDNKLTTLLMYTFGLGVYKDAEGGWKFWFPFDGVTGDFETCVLHNYIGGGACYTYTSTQDYTFPFGECTNEYDPIPIPWLVPCEGLHSIHSDNLDLFTYHFETVYSEFDESYTTIWDIELRKIP